MSQNNCIGLCDEMRSYDVNRFDLGPLTSSLTVPLPDEPFLGWWQGLLQACVQGHAFEVLAEQLPQLCFPVRRGMSSNAEYRAAVRSGACPVDLAAATGLELQHPEKLEITIYEGCACRVPVVIAGCREDFVALVQALARSNEPVPVSPSQGAMMLVGFNNWGRIQTMRQAWENTPASQRSTATWNEEFSHVRQRPELYQDCFVLVSDGPYSSIPAQDLGLDSEHWLKLSLAIRCEHECTHYLTRRLFGSMKNHALDELIADYSGLVASVGRFRSDWFLRFLGVDGRVEGTRRLDLYRGDPPLTDSAMVGLEELLRAAAEQVQVFDDSIVANGGHSPQTRSCALFALASFRLTELAAATASDRLLARYKELTNSVHFLQSSNGAWIRPSEKLSGR